MIRTANLFGLKMTLTVSKISAIESTTCVTKLVFNEEPADSVVARQLEPRQLRAEPLIGCLEICTVFSCGSVHHTNPENMDQNTTQHFLT